MKPLESKLKSIKLKLKSVGSEAQAIEIIKGTLKVN